MKIQSQTYTTVAANLTGFASNVTGATWTLTNNVVTGSDLAHNVTIRNDSVTDHSAKTAILTGTGPDGEAQTETLNLPGTSATVTSTKYFKTLTSIVPSATILTDTMDIGWAVTAVGNTLPLNWRQHPFTVSIATYPSGTSNHKVQQTYEDVLNTVGSYTWYDHASLTNKSAAAEGTYTAPVTATRLVVNTWTSGTIRMIIVQGNAG